MKKILISVFFLIVGLATSAQTPQMFNYQAALRDASGNVLANQDVEIEINLVQDTVTNVSVFSETHSVTTNDFGLVNLQIGSVNTADMENINWSSGPYFIQISVDGTVMGTSRLLSVPYALFAGSSSDGDNDPANELQDISLSGTELSISGGSTVDLSPIADSLDKQTLSFGNNRYLTISNGNTVRLPFVLNETDANPTNEIQEISISNDTIYLSKDGGSVELPAETDPVFSNWDKSTGIEITESQISDLKHFTNADEVDPVYAADSAFFKNAIAKNQQAIIDTASLLRTDLATKVALVDTAILLHSETAQNQQAIIDTASLLRSDLATEIALADTATLLHSETAQNKQAIIDTAANIRADMFTTELDPVFSSWDKSTGIEITESQISDLDHFTNADESDPIFESSLAAGLTSADTAHWGKDSDPTNEIQALSISNDTIFLSDGGSVKLPGQGGDVSDVSENYILKWGGDSIVESSVYDNGNVGIGTDTPDSSAIMEIKSSSKGVLFPRMTQQEIISIASPANSLMVFCTDDDKFYSFISAENVWKEIAYGTNTLTGPGTYSIGSGSSCSNTTVNGSYFYSLALDSSNAVILDVDVTVAGAWSISTNTVNGYSFSGSGVFVSTGTNQVTLYASGTPVSAQTDDFTATAHSDGSTCTFSIDVTVETVVSLTGETWMAYNLGASRVATSSSDTEAYGDYYQWGRATEGHEKASSNTYTTQQASSPLPDVGNDWDGLFITAATNWLSTADNTLWQGVSGTNNPCPAGFRVPTKSEWESELSAYSNDLYNSPLKLPYTGFRNYSNGVIYLNGSYTSYWSSTVVDTKVSNAYGLTTDGLTSSYKAHGMPVRCIKK